MKNKPELNGRPLGLWLKLQKLKQRAAEPIKLDVDLDSRDDLIAESAELKAQIEKLMDRRDCDPYTILKTDDEIAKLQRRCGAIGRALANIQAKFSEVSSQAAAGDREIAALRARLASHWVNTSSDPSARTDKSIIDLFFHELSLENCHRSELTGRTAKLRAAREVLEEAIRTEFGVELDELLSEQDEEQL